MHCGTEIRSRDNIPVVSYLLLRGRAKSCRAPIGVRYPAVELGTALLVAACVVAFGPSLHALAAAIFCVALVVISATDLEHRIVPNKVVLPAAAVVLALQLAWHPTIQWPAAGLGAALFLFIAALAYPRGMGMGDVKLALLLGVGVGRAVPVALFLAMVGGARPVARALRPPRPRRPEDEDPVRAVPRARRGRRPLRRERDARLVSALPLASG